MWKYFEDIQNFRGLPNKNLNKNRKKQFYNDYEQNGLKKDLDISIPSRKIRLRRLLLDNYTPKDGKILYKHFINRASFWMATGSGKTIIIIKLIEILKQLIDRGEIPNYDILFLTYREDLLEQFKDLVDEFNNWDNEVKILLKDLREYSEIKRQKVLLNQNELIIYYYRSDNLSDVQKEKIIDFRNYNDNGKWYVILDEAHKGDREESIRQQIFSIMSKNGFLFNFSATFTDPRDKITCAFEFNLGSFIKSGYGKNIYLLKQEIKGFQRNQKFTDDEKKKLILKSLVLLSYIKTFSNKIRNLNDNLYHQPLLMTLVNTVNTKDADLKLFFRELAKVSNDDFDKSLLEESKKEVLKEFEDTKEFFFEDDKHFILSEKTLKNIDYKDILNLIFNTKSPGEIEVIRRLSNKKELAFKLKTSEIPFALIKIGNITEWLKRELTGYNIQEKLREESYFENLNEKDSNINILMGSQSFYEGWDSNRPNVITFINIGKSRNAKKYILQSVGRGIRIEPIKDERKRLIRLYNSKIIPNEIIDEKLFNEINNLTHPVESLFIFGTNRNAINTVIQELEQQKGSQNEFKLSCFSKNEFLSNKKLFIPTYKISNQPIIKEKNIKFEISKKDLDLIRKYLDYIKNDRIIIFKFGMTPGDLKNLRRIVKDDEYFKRMEKEEKNISLLIRKLLDFFTIRTKIFKEFKLIDNEINHHNKISIISKHSEVKNDLKQKLKKVMDYPNNMKSLMKLHDEISLAEYTERANKLSKEEIMEINSNKIKIRFFKNHYYNPLVLVEGNKKKLLKHVIDVESEVEFIKDLKKYLDLDENQFKNYDWWSFSKIDEHLDEIFIPYFDNAANKMRKFHPDFIFWFKEGKSHTILFLDPKGTEYTNWIDKVEGYKYIFEDKGVLKEFHSNGFQIKIKLLLRTKDLSNINNRFSNYSRFWFDKIKEIFDAF